MYHNISGRLPLTTSNNEDPNNNNNSNQSMTDLHNNKVGAVMLLCYCVFGEFGGFGVVQIHHFVMLINISRL